MSALRQIREQQNLTQEELSAKSGVSVRTIQRVESGASLKGHTLRALCDALGTTHESLRQQETLTKNEIPPRIVENAVQPVDYGKIKLINLSSLLFIVLPPLNILFPLLLSHLLKQRNPLTRQIVSLQVMWTILAPIVFMCGIFLKLGRSFTIVILGIIVLSNVFLILRNLAEIDRRKRLYFDLKFNML